MNIKTVVIDAGHGGTDAGAINGNVYEKDKVLLFAKELARVFKNIGVTPILTRSTDENISLSERTAMEQAVNSACCISCHMDAGNIAASGMTVWLHSNAPKRYVDWAQDVIDELKIVGFTSNRSQEIYKGYVSDPNANFAWNRLSHSPSILLELGFITNAANLKEFDENYKDYAQAVASATCRFIGINQPNCSAPTPDCVKCKQELLNNFMGILK